MTDPARPGQIVRVAVDIPGSQGFDYLQNPAASSLAVRGSWVLVPWGKTRRIGIVVALPERSELPAERLREILGVVDSAPTLDEGWLKLAEFAARYYHCGIGEVLLPAIPKLLRTVPGPRARGSAFERARRRGPLAGASIRPEGAPAAGADAGAGADVLPAGAELTADLVLNPDQQRALDALRATEGFAVHLLHGVTGSGKTEVYLRWIAGLLAARSDAQVLLLVPEIALTPQLFGQIAARFPDEAVAVLHSGLPDGERAAHWLAAAEGRVRLVVGTRLAVLTPLPGLAGVIVDEEHDASYRQQEGVRYSARDLAVALGSQRKVPVLLGSATPSFESWLAAERGRYRLLAMPERVHGGVLPALRIVDPRGRKLRHGLAPETVDTIGAALARGEQALVFINRRGYAPVLNCDSCGWLSQCDACSAYRVLHRHGAPGGSPGPRRYRLVCHHCSSESAVPRACPGCGNLDLTPLGSGTQRLEEGLHELFPGARIARLDRDVARRRDAAREVIDAAHAGEVDLLVGTQMLAKGHDFRRLTVVAAIDPDGGLYSADFRAPERLFSVLMQVAGRAGRAGAASRVIVQTRFPGHPLFAALARHDYAGFANAQLAERREAQLPPYLFQALLRAEARSLDAALAFLAEAKAIAEPGDPPSEPPQAPPPAPVAVYDPVPMPMMRVAGSERAQLLIESASRVALHAFLDRWLERLGALRAPVRWQLEVDPIEI